MRASTAALAIAARIATLVAMHSAWKGAKTTAAESVTHREAQGRFGNARNDEKRHRILTPW